MAELMEQNSSATGKVTLVSTTKIDHKPLGGPLRFHPDMEAILDLIENKVIVWVKEHPLLVGYQDPPLTWTEGHYYLDLDKATMVHWKPDPEPHPQDDPNDEIEEGQEVT